MPERLDDAARGRPPVDVLGELQELVQDMRDNGMVIQIRRIGTLDIDVLEALVQIAVHAHELIEQAESELVRPHRVAGLRAAVARLDEIGADRAALRAGS